MSNNSYVYDKIKSVILKEKIIHLCKKSPIHEENNYTNVRDVVKLIFSEEFIKSKDVRRFLIVSIERLFSDTLPGYKVRVRTEAEKNSLLKKDTRKLWEGEEVLLRAYHKYITFLRIIAQDKTLKKLPNSYEDIKTQTYTNSDKIIAFRCLSSLYINHPDFNHSDEILNLLSNQINHGSDEIQEELLQRFREFFQNDFNKDHTLRVCKALHRTAKNCNFKVGPSLLKALSFVPISEVPVKEEDGKMMTHRDRKMKMSRKERRLDKKDKNLKKDLKEMEATKAKDNLIKLNELCLNEILFVYFKILKQETNYIQMLSEKENSKTISNRRLPLALMGLSTFAYHINVDYVEDLITLLNGIIKNSEKIYGTQVSLYCLHTLIVIMTKSSASTTLKQYDFGKLYDHLHDIFNNVCGIYKERKVQEYSDYSSQGKDWVESGYYFSSNTPAAQCSRLIAEEKSRRNKKKMKELKRSVNISSSDEISMKNTRVLSCIRSSDNVSMDEVVDLLIGCLRVLILRHRGQSGSGGLTVARALTFAKQLITLAINVVEPSTCSSVLICLVQLFTMNPQCDALFDPEIDLSAQIPAMMVFKSNSSSLWELLSLVRHFSPIVSHLAKLCIKMGRSMSNSFTSEENFIINIGLEKITDDHNLNALFAMNPCQVRHAMAAKEISLAMSQIQMDSLKKTSLGKKRKSPSHIKRPGKVKKQKFVS